MRRRNLRAAGFLSRALILSSEPSLPGRLAHPLEILLGTRTGFTVHLENPFVEQSLMIMEDSVQTLWKIPRPTEDALSDLVHEASVWMIFKAQG